MEYPTKPSLTNSQNFLHRGKLIDQLLDRSSIQPGDLVLDLGAGVGVIARRLAERGCRVLAVEKDPLLAASLRSACADAASVKVCQIDILRLQLPDEPYKVFSNIPFDATAEIINRLTRARNPPEDAYLVVQREAAARFVGQPDATLVSVLLAPFFETSIVHEFRRTDFKPMPRVDIVMLRLRKRGPPLLQGEQTRFFRQFVIHSFMSWKGSLDQVLPQIIGRRCAVRLLRDLGLGATSPSRVPPLHWVQLFDSASAVAGPELRWRLAGTERRLQSQQRRLRKLHRTRHRRLRPPPLGPLYRSAVGSRTGLTSRIGVWFSVSSSLT